MSSQTKRKVFMEYFFFLTFPVPLSVGPNLLNPDNQLTVSIWVHKKQTEIHKHENNFNKKKIRKLSLGSCLK